MTTILSIAILWGFTFIACLERINPGEVGVVVNLLGSEKGVEEKELKVGYHLITPWQKIYRFPIFDQNHQWTESEGFSFQTQEGLSVHADIGISFNLLPAKVHELFCKYRRGMQEITDLFIRNNVRDAINRHASKMKIEDLYGQKKEEFFNEILSDLHKELQPLGFNISHIYIIGRFGVPDNVKEALNRKIEATQRAQQRENELREAEAEAKKQIAFTEGSARSAMITAKATADALLLEAKAQAEANRMLSQSLTREVIEYQATLKWNGILPSAMSGEQMPFLLSVGGRK
jgi:regulator of protease activity HflC (stomatin/prohibitin superfamily)